MVSHRESEENEAKYAAVIRFAHDWFVPAFNAVLKPFPFVRRALGRTSFNRIGQIDRLIAADKIEEAFELAVSTAPGLLQPKSWVTGWFWKSPGPEMMWWIAVANAAWCARTPEQRQRVIGLVSGAPGPGGVSEARTLDTISRWRWQHGNQAGAVETARSAVAADETWPWSYLTLAFYLREANLGDPLPVLVDAAKADPACIDSIEKQFSGEIAAAVRAAVKPS